MSMACIADDVRASNKIENIMTIGEIMTLMAVISKKLEQGDENALFKEQVIRSIQEYLATFKGIGPALAKRIVTDFGIYTVLIIEKCPVALELVKYIGEKRAEAIKKGWAMQQWIRDTSAELISLYTDSAASNDDNISKGKKMEME
jgi:hypothetical protein